MQPSVASPGAFRSALIPGSLAAIAAALLNLPLQSPLDAYFNSASVVAGALAFSVVAGLIWARVRNRRRALPTFALMMAAAAAVTVGGAAFAEAFLSGSVGYFVPLALLTIGLTAVLIPLSTSGRLPTGLVSSWPFLGASALAVGVMLAGRGDAENATLSLPAASAPATPNVSAGSNVRPVMPEQAASPANAPTSGAPAGATPPDGVDADDPGASLGAYDSVRFVISEGSKATFTVGEKLVRLPLPNDAILTTSALSGDAYLDGRPSTIEIDVHKLTSDQQFRDRYVRTEMFPGQPIATFTVPGLDGVPDGLGSGEEISATIAGLLNIRSRDFPIEFDIQARDDGDVLYVVGKTTFTWAQLGLQTPRSIAVTSVEDQVQVQILLVMRPAFDQKG